MTKLFYEMSNYQYQVFQSTIIALRSNILSLHWRLLNSCFFPMPLFPPFSIKFHLWHRNLQIPRHTWFKIHSRDSNSKVEPKYLVPYSMDSNPLAPLPLPSQDPNTPHDPLRKTCTAPLLERRIVMFHESRSPRLYSAGILACCRFAGMKIILV